VTPLRNKQNSGYYLFMRVGDSTLNNIFEMLLDISAPWTWIPDQTCTNCFKTNIRSKYYDCSSSPKTCFQNKTSPEDTLVYSIGTVQAIGGYDLVQWTGLPFNSSVNHTLGFGLEVSSNFYSMDADGVFGLGISNSTDNAGLVSIIDTLYNQGWIANKTFSMFLTFDPDDEDEKSQIKFGGYDVSKIAPGKSFQTFHVSIPEFWSLPLGGLQVGDAKVTVQAVNIVPSTTYAGIGVPEDDFSLLLSEFKKQNIICELVGSFHDYICPCPESNLAIFPDIGFNIENQVLLLPNTVYMSVLAIDIKDEDGDILRRKDHNCVLGFSNLPNGSFNPEFGNPWIFGTSVLRYYYTHFDMENNTISFAVANEPFIDNSISPSLLITLVAGTVIFLVLGGGWIIYKCTGIYKKTRGGRVGGAGSSFAYHSL